MSLFLLVSIGSVCASDVAMDADAQLAIDESSSIVSANETVTPANDTAQKIDTSVISEDVKINEKETANIPVTVKDNESQDISIVKGDLNVTENNKTVNFEYANSSIIINNLAAGKHNLIINYLGNANYTNSSTKIVLSIVGNYTLSVPSSVNVNSTKNAVIPINLTDSVDVYPINEDDLTLILSYKDGNDTVNETIDKSRIKFINGTLQFNYDINATSSSLIINYINGNKTLTKTVALKRIYNAKIIPLNLEAEYASGEFTFKLVDVDTNETLSGKKLSYTIITGTINTGGPVTTDDEGIATMDNSVLTIYKMENGTISQSGHISVGKQLFSIKTDDSSIISTEVRDNFTVTKVEINIVINPYKEYYQSDKKVVINVTNAKTGEAMKGIILHLNMPGTSAKDYYFQTDNNGTSQINVSGLIGGTYKLSVSNNDTENIKYENATGEITILKLPAKIVTKDYTLYYNTGNTATIKVTDASGKALSGVYVLVQIYTGSKSTAYLLQTNDKGTVTFAVPLAVGSHKMVVTLADNRYDAKSVTKKITVKKATAKIAASKATGYFKSGSTYVIKLVNSKNNKAIYGAKLNIKIFISKYRYYNYNGQTGADGKLRISLDSFKPGTYKIVISKGESKNYTAAQKTSQFIVKKAPVKFTPKKLTAKKGKSTYFKVTVKNTKTKKVVSSGVKVKIKVYTGKKYKTYTVKTNSKGIAQLNVKSLKVGTHKVVVSSGISYVVGKAAASSIKITK